MNNTRSNKTPKKTTTKKPRGSSRREQGFFSRHALSLGIAACVVVVTVIAAAVFSLKSYNGDTSVRIIIPSGSTAAAVADTLRSRLGDRGYGARVYSLWRLQGGQPGTATGAYTVSPGMSALRLSRRLATGAQSPVKVSFTSTRGLERMAGRITRDLQMSPDEFLTATREVLSDSAFTPEQFPGVFIPDTYEVYWTITPKALVKKFLAHYRRFWNSRDRLEKARRLGLTPLEVSTLASIVEEETSKPDERGVVARLYLNRLDRGMRLQADPTVKAAIGDETIRRVTHAMLATPSPYNTYLHPGLPPGPIRIVEPSTIDAVLDAPVHDYIYMCAKEDFSGYHNFATTYPEHEANARRYQAELDRRGIK